MITVSSIASRLPFYYGWSVLGMVMLAGSLAAASTSPFMAVMLKPMTDDLGWSRTEATTVISVGTIGIGVASPFIGRLADRFGPRLLFPIGGVLLSLAFFVIAGVNALWQFYFGYILARSIASSLIAGVGAQTTVVNWFVRRRGRAMGLVVMTLPLANAVQAPLAQWFMDIADWRGVFLILGAMSAVVIIVPSAIIVRRRPEDVGLYPDGASSPPQGGGRGGGRQVPAGTHAREFDFTLQQAMHTPVFWLLILASFLSILGGGAVSFHQVAYFQDIGLTPEVAAASISAFTLAGAFSSGLWGFLSERVSERGLAVVLTAIGALVVLAMLEVNNEAMALLVSGAYGLTTRGGVTLFNLLLANYYGRGNFGAISGFFGSFSSFGLGVGPFIGALLFDITGAYRILFVVISGTFLATAVLLFFIREPPLPTEAEASVEPVGGIP
jgi:MFS family permease